jgi:hypothetical protein
MLERTARTVLGLQVEQRLGGEAAVLQQRGRRAVGRRGHDKVAGAVPSFCETRRAAQATRALRHGAAIAVDVIYIIIIIIHIVELHGSCRGMNGGGPGQWRGRWRGAALRVSRVQRAIGHVVQRAPVQIGHFGRCLKSRRRTCCTICVAAAPSQAPVVQRRGRADLCRTYWNGNVWGLVVLSHVCMTGKL